MTRPQFIRADTIDLQDQTSPSAQDHSRKPHTTGIGPAPSSHQAAELRHVQEERHSEEESLSQAWNQANGLSDEPPSEDDDHDFSNGMHGDQNLRHNAGHGDDHDMADAESGDDMDDDMMDKISSSPSISDGALPTSHYSSSPYSPWPRRASSMGAANSLRAHTPPMRDFSTASSDGSSPFVQTPAHLPLSPFHGGSPSPSPSTPYAGRGAQTRPNTQMEYELDTSSSSPFTTPPAHFPLRFPTPPPKQQVQSTVHHRFVGFVTPPDCEGEAAHEDEGFDEIEFDDMDDERCDTLGPLHSTNYTPRPIVPSNQQQDKSMYLQPAEMIKSASDMELDCQLLPADDPLLDDSTDDTSNNLFDYDDDGEWETESESCSVDSFETADYNADDEPEALLFPSDSRFVDSGWGGECLREPEDIDFESVYALHTFVATVEGQANAQKGDTMVLLDDSNSYWWLVRVLKDSTIGYLPAEHIETPTERLARLNKHRNVDLSQTMLGDTTEKTKNPLKKAMRRRNAKTVTFSAPTYVEPSDYEFSSDEDEEAEGSLTGATMVDDGDGNNQDERDQDEISAAGPGPGGAKQASGDSSPEKTDPFEDPEEERRRAGEESRTSDEIFDRECMSEFRDSEGGPLTSSLVQGPAKSRNGTVRNTDSFFRDESIETRKITLTPNILRDDSTPSTKASVERERPSFDLLQPDSKETKIKDKKDKKEKKPGMLSGLFKRNNKKKGVVDIDGPRPGKVSGESSRESASMDLDRDSPVEKQAQLEAPVQRSGSRGKLVKSPPSPLSPAALSPTGPRPAGAPDLALQKQPSPDSSVSSESTPRANSPEKGGVKPALRVEPLQQNQNGGMLSGLSDKLRSPSREGSNAVKREKIKRAKQREALDVESSPEDEKQTDPFADQFEVGTRGQTSSSQNKSSGAASSAERLSESPVHITSADAAPDNEPPALVGDSSSSSSADDLASLRSSPSPPVTSATITEFGDPTQFHEPTPVLSPSGSSTPSPSSPVQPTAPLSFSRPHPPPKSLAPPPPTRDPPPQPGLNANGSPISSLPPLTQTASKESFQSAASHAEVVARNNSTSTTASRNLASPPVSSPWSDAHLRAYLDDSSEIRDLLLLVSDTHGVVPVGPEHELMRDLYREERGKIAEMNASLDGLLGGWLAKKKGGATVGGARRI